MALNLLKQGKLQRAIQEWYAHGKVQERAAPGKKPGAKQQINVEVKTRKNCEKTLYFRSPTEILKPP